MRVRGLFISFDIIFKEALWTIRVLRCNDSIRAVYLNGRRKERKLKKRKKEQKEEEERLEEKKRNLGGERKTFWFCYLE